MIVDPEQHGQRGSSRSGRHSMKQNETVWNVSDDFHQRSHRNTNGLMDSNSMKLVKDRPVVIIYMAF